MDWTPQTGSETDPMVQHVPIQVMPIMQAIRAKELFQANPGASPV